MKTLDWWVLGIACTLLYVGMSVFTQNLGGWVRSDGPVGLFWPFLLPMMSFFSKPYVTSAVILGLCGSYGVKRFSDISCAKNKAKRIAAEQEADRILAREQIL